VHAAFLLVRGVFGLLQALYVAGNLFDFGGLNYEDNGAGSRIFSGRMVVEETLMATLMELVAASLFVGTYWTSKRDERGAEDTPPDQLAYEQRYLQMRDMAVAASTKQVTPSSSVQEAATALGSA
jgi:hypothetical protein